VDAAGGPQDRHGERGRGGSASSRGGAAAAVCPRLHAVAQAELAEHAGDVRLHSGVGQEQRAVVFAYETGLVKPRGWMDRDCPEIRRGQARERHGSTI
jgi:hypothetical protein